MIKRIKNYFDKNHHNKPELPLLHSRFRDLAFSCHAMQKLLQEYKFESVLDIGSGNGEHAGIFRDSGKRVTCIDFGGSVYFENRKNEYEFISGDYNNHIFEKKFDLIWASHVLEHQPDAGSFFKKIFNDCKENGLVAITVPPMKNEIVGGHLSVWNAGLIMYHILFAGYDCRDVSVLKYGYNISVIIRKKKIENFPDLNYDHGDIKKFLPHLPDGFDEPFNGDIHRLNW